MTRALDCQVAESDTAKWWPPTAAGMTEDHDDHEHHTHDLATERTTAPQSAYTARDVAFGAAVAAVGLLVTFAIPLLLA